MRYGVKIKVKVEVKVNVCWFVQAVFERPNVGDTT